MADKIIKGESVIIDVLVDGTYLPFACADNCEINFSPEIRYKTTVGDGRGRVPYTRRIDWSVSVSGVAIIEKTNYYKIFQTLTPTEIVLPRQIQLTFTDTDGNSRTFKGTVLLSSAGVGAGTDLADFDAEYTGVGLWTMVEYDAPNVNNNVFGPEFGPEFN